MNNWNTLKKYYLEYWFRSDDSLPLIYYQAAFRGYVHCLGDVGCIPISAVVRLTSCSLEDLRSWSDVEQILSDAQRFGKTDLDWVLEDMEVA